MHFPRNKLANYLKHMRRIHPERCVQSERLAENTLSNDIFDTVPGHLQGLNAFVAPVRQMTIKYACTNGGCAGTREFLSQRLPSIASENPSVEFVIDPSLKPIKAALKVTYCKSKK